jgi:hypothetical protein
MRALPRGPYDRAHEAAHARVRGIAGAGAAAGRMPKSSVRAGPPPDVIGDRRPPWRRPHVGPAGDARARHEGGDDGRAVVLELGSSLLLGHRGGGVEERPARPRWRGSARTRNFVLHGRQPAGQDRLPDFGTARGGAGGQLVRLTARRRALLATCCCTSRGDLHAERPEATGALRVRSSQLRRALRAAGELRITRPPGYGDGASASRL